MKKTFTFLAALFLFTSLSFTVGCGPLTDSVDDDNACQCENCNCEDGCECGDECNCPNCLA